MQTAQESIKTIGDWLSASRPDAPRGYVGSPAVLRAIAKIHPDADLTFDSLNVLIQTPAFQKANIKWERQPYPETYKENLATVLRKFTPKTCKDENGFFRPGLAAKMNTILHDEFGANWSIENIRAALYKARDTDKESGEALTRREVEEELGKRLSEKDMKERGHAAARNAAIAQGREEYVPEQTDAMIVESIMRDMERLKSGHFKYVQETNHKIKLWKEQLLDASTGEWIDPAAGPQPGQQTRAATWKDIQARYKRETESYLADLEIERMTVTFPPGKTVGNREAYSRRLVRAVVRARTQGMSSPEIARMIKDEYDAIHEGRPPKAELIYDSEHP
jgi:hypothetical protein